MSDWRDLYVEHVAGLTALAARLAPEQASLRVPGSPEWTVREVTAHLAGVASDTVTGRTEGAPRPPWTQRQVDERRSHTLPDLVAELSSLQGDVVATFGAGPQGTVFDIATHHADLREALGESQLADALWRPVLDAMSDRVGPVLLAQVPPYELFRAVFSRRSRRQVRAWGSPLPPEQLDALGVFGPREDDQPVTQRGL